MNRTLRNIHRYVSLAIAAVWLIQAVSGMILVFGRELDELGTQAPVQTLDAAALGKRIEALQARAPGTEISYVLATGGAPDRYDILLHGAAQGDTYVRVDGAGNELRERPYDRDFPGPGLFYTVLSLHQTAFSGDTGTLFVGLSGLVLLVNIVLGLKLAWPRVGQWLRVLVGRGDKGVAGVASIYAWHRRLGLWLAIPALLLVIAGVLMAIGGPIQDWARGSIDSPSTDAYTRDCPNGCAAMLTPGEAIATAMQRYPGAALSLMQMPDAATPWYRLRLKQADDIRRVFGTTTVFIDKRNGKVIATFEPATNRGAVNFFDSLYPVHTGEVMGLAGRWVSFAVGLWLATMIVLGVTLWWRRRSPARP